jgi:hypothetical protein
VFKNRVVLGIACLLLGAVLGAGGCFYYASDVIAGHLESERANSETIGQLRSERARATTIVVGLAGTAKSNLEIIRELRKLVEVYGIGQ